MSAFALRHGASEVSARETHDLDTLCGSKAPGKPNELSSEIPFVLQVDGEKQFTDVTGQLRPRGRPECWEHLQ